MITLTKCSFIMTVLHTVISLNTIQLTFEKMSSLDNFYHIIISFTLKLFVRFGVKCEKGIYQMISLAKCRFIRTIFYTIRSLNIVKLNFAKIPILDNFKQIIVSFILKLSVRFGAKYGE